MQPLLCAHRSSIAHEEIIGFMMISSHVWQESQKSNALSVGRSSENVQSIQMASNALSKWCRIGTNYTEASWFRTHLPRDGRLSLECSSLTQRGAVGKSTADWRTRYSRLMRTEGKQKRIMTHGQVKKACHEDPGTLHFLQVDAWDMFDWEIIGWVSSELRCCGQRWLKRSSFWSSGHYRGWRGWSENCFLLGLPLGSGCWCRSHQPISSQPFLKQECLYMFKVAPPWNKRLELLIAKCRAHPRKSSKWGCAAYLSTQKSLSLAKNFQIASRTGFINGPLCFSLLSVLMIWWYGWYWMREWLS